MAMQGIDISGYQAGLDLSQVPHDFAIIKATEGMSYVNPQCDGWVQQEIHLGKCWGVYHYIDGGDATAEADFFLGSISGYVGHGLICVDWESGGNSAWGDEGYLRTFVQRIIDRTGIKPIIYASATAFPWQLAQELDCGAWVAQYADMNPTGYQASPWNEDAYLCAIRQYSSCGRLDGWGGSLDLDLAYMDASAWAAYVGSAQAQNAGNKDGDTMEPHDVWEYDYIDPATGKGTAVGGNVYNELYALAHNLTEPYESPAGDGVTGSLMDRICYMDMRIREMYAQEAAQTEAIKALAEAKGADPDAIAQAVSDAVQKKLESLKLEVTA